MAHPESLNRQQKVRDSWLESPKVVKHPRLFMNNTVGLTENFNIELKEVEYGSYAKTGPIFLFHIFKKSQKRFHFSQVTKKKNEINVPVLTVCFNDSRNTGKLSIKAVH